MAFVSEVCLLSALVFPSALCFALEGAAAVCLAFGVAAAAGEAIGLGVSSCLAGATSTDFGGSGADWNRAPMPITTGSAERPTTKISHS